MTPPRLVGDIGGTHARFGLVEPTGELTRVKGFECSSYPTLVAAVQDYLSTVGVSSQPSRAAIAVACPVLQDHVQMTNHVWSFSVADVREQLRLEVLDALNDLHALALALPSLTPEDTRTIKPGRPEETAPRAVLGVGTGLGVSALIPSPERSIALSTEGGHRDLAASTEREWRIVERIAQRFGRVSAERVLSGPGLANLHWAIRDLEGHEPLAHTPQEVVMEASEGGCEACVEAVQLFSRLLGAVAGDLALTLGARGGVFLGGGVIPRMGDTFDVELFQQGFLSKGRFRDYVEAIPVELVTNPTTALLGAAKALETFLDAGRRSAASTPFPQR